MKIKHSHSHLMPPFTEKRMIFVEFTEIDPALDISFYKDRLRALNKACNRMQEEIKQLKAALRESNDQWLNFKLYP